MYGAMREPILDLDAEMQTDDLSSVCVDLDL